MASDRPRDPEVHTITDAPEALSDDLSRRAHRYLVQMTLRVACFIGAVVVDHWTRWLMLVGAVVLPYVAVVLANAGRTPGERPASFVVPRQLEGPREPAQGSGPVERRPGPVGGRTVPSADEP